jgi:hypothetical protein
MRPISILFALVATMSPAAAVADPDDDASLSWQLRPVTIGNLARIDSAAAAFKDDNGNLDLAIATTVTASYQVADAWAPMLRLGLVGNNAPGAALDGSALANPLVGATYARAIGDYRLAVFGGATLPIGTGLARTHTASMTARPADRAMFDVDDLAAVAGVDVAYVHGGFTAQGEATLTDARPSFGVHVGYVVGWHVAIGGDLLYDDALTASLGVRAQFELADQTWIRPGIAVLRGLDARGLDAPLLTAQTTAVMLDVPVTF